MVECCGTQVKVCWMGWPGKIGQLDSQIGLDKSELTERTLKSPDALPTEHRRMNGNDYEATMQRLLRRINYLLDRSLCSYCCEEKNGIWAKGTFEEKSQWRPDVNECSDCKYLA